MSVFTSVCIAKTSLVALMHCNETFTSALNGIRNEIGSEYEITILDVDKVKDVAVLNEQIKKINPQALILMDIKAIRFCEEVVKVNNNVQALPKFILMTLQVEQSAKKLKNVCGVRFEVPAYTLLTQFRQISGKDFSKVGIFYRNFFTPTIEEAKRLLAKEKIEVMGICIDCDQKNQLTSEKAVSIMKKRLKEFKVNKVEVFWIPADNLIVNVASFVELWQPLKRDKYPIIVPLENLASIQTDMGIFAATTSSPELGAQVGSQIIEMFENETPVEDIGFEPLIRVNSVLNMEVAKSIGWTVNKEKLNKVNKILEKK
jgi:hypothetical protein